MIKTAYTVGNKEVQAYIPDKTSYKALAELYDVCNDLFNEPDCFYTKEDLTKMKKDPTNTFLRGAKR